MVVERTKDEVIIRISSAVDTEDLQELLDYIRFKEITSKFNSEQKDVDKLVKTINTKWWSKNRPFLIE
jgi:maltodextrin utilization protein YvdJ